MWEIEIGPIHKICCSATDFCQVDTFKEAGMSIRILRIGLANNKAIKMAEIKNTWIMSGNQIVPVTRKPVLTSHSNFLTSVSLCYLRHNRPESATVV